MYITKVNVNIDPTYNIFEGAGTPSLEQISGFPSLSALGDSLKEVFELDATTSVLAATDQHSTAQHKEASRLEELADIFRVEDVSSPVVLTCCIVCLVLILQPLLGG
jgi:hypothetical protein